MQLSRLKSKLQRQIPAFGVWLTIPSPLTARALAAQGFDWACIDMEHAPTNPAVMAEMVAAVASCGTCAPIVRVPSQASEWFKWALDAGAHGIIVPMVNTPEELRKAESLCRYPPAGKRSIGAFFAPGVFGLRGPRAMSDYVERVSNDILVIPQIESVEGAINLPNMLKEGGLDAVFVGPYDLNASVRYAQDMQIQDVLAHIEKSAKDAEVPLGIYAPSGAAVGSKVREGYTLVVAASDIECMASSALENLDRARSESRHHR
ncbi:Phosphoenolpyruvate/pyruvate domain-containing protein [Coemansia reversa NRRL 1564]|uniref:Phosphoenolpyruvate/pyruvate domain-containing protein n=1 Tax=Coemansia reversa (strain ATCC 12441 / NRRL 1564) TaxID=763665 RepID=A0A2G5BBJ7_COERN|nr:Phosphoenolpyruvate/pyruvate domain-containing protein [Coemansia reversa NRRL 1564]|eukprot:PIA16381.1 Phosphoenolpyruvate/pyruvate domain-containing protein [Coemansia reversa NRRL 1564]